MQFYDISISPLEPTAVYPNDKPTSLTEEGQMQVQGYRLHNIEMSLHSGTHIDFPAHFIMGGKLAENYTLDEFILHATVVPEDIALETAAVMKEGQALLVKTQNKDSQWKTDGINLELAQMCTAQGLAMVGIDQLSVDGDNTYDFTIHQMLLGSGIRILENLNLQDVPAGDYRLLCFPLKIETVEAAPTRAVLLSLDWR